MRKFSKNSFNITEAINELMHESGVIVIENAYNLNDIKEARCEERVYKQECAYQSQLLIS